MSINQLKKNLELAIKTNNFDEVKFLLFKQFPNPKKMIRKPKKIDDKHFTIIQKDKLEYCYRLIKLNRSFYRKKKFHNIKNQIIKDIAEKLYSSKSTGWLTGLKGSSSSIDHIFPRKDVAKYYLNKNRFNRKDFIYSYRHLFGLTILITLNENICMEKSIEDFYNQYNLTPEEVLPYLLPITAYYYKFNNIQIKNVGNHQIPFDNLRKYILSLFF
jgi:hypothetical protein